MKTWILTIFGIIIVVLFLFWLFKPANNPKLPSQAFSVQESPSGSNESPLQRQEVKAVDYTLSTYSGEQVSFASVIAEKPIVIQIWATWCHVCEREFPENNVIAKKYQDQIAYHAISIGGRDQSPEAIKKYVEKRNLDPNAIKFLVDINGDVSSQYAFNSTPQHLFINKKGIINYYQAGYMTPQELEQQILNII